MAKYKFKWWHAVLGLVGLSVAARAVQRAHGGNFRPDPRPGEPEKFTYRGAFIEVGAMSPGFYWSVSNFDGGQTLKFDESGTAKQARDEARAWVDEYLRLLGPQP